jgi:sugar phosphate isomerase/epimerase
MMLGAMNNPASNPVSEVKRIGEAGFSFVDLTSEPPRADARELKKRAKGIADALSQFSLKVVGHTAWYHEFANPYESVRKAHEKEFRESAEALAALGAKKVGIHPDNMAFAHKSRGQYIARYVEAVASLDRFCADLGVRLLIETFEDRYLTADELEKCFEAAPGAGFTLDVGHANLIRPEGAGIGMLAKRFAGRLAHVHASDNDGKSDLHLPIGAGKINWPKACAALKEAGYDGTVTLEVFSPDQGYLELSRNKMEKIWASA